VNNATDQCEIACDAASAAAGRRLEEELALEELGESEYVVSLNSDPASSSYASAIVQGYLAKHPDLARRMGGIDLELLTHLDKIGQLFGQPALA
jgi:hypothetical protein